MLEYVTREVTLTDQSMTSMTRSRLQGTQVRVSPHSLSLPPTKVCCLKVLLELEMEKM